MRITNIKGCSTICPGDVLTYECTVVGGPQGEATILRGKSSFLDCYNKGSRGQEITLFHKEFDEGTSGTCNNGTILMSWHIGQQLQYQTMNM